MKFKSIKMTLMKGVNRLKIVKLPKKYDMKEYYKKEALKGCESCPFCGENKKWGYNIHASKFEGILSRVCITWYGRKDRLEKFSLRKLIPQKSRNWKVSYFECKTCGATWESEPYEY